MFCFLRGGGFLYLRWFDGLDDANEMMVEGLVNGMMRMANGMLFNGFTWFA